MTARESPRRLRWLTLADTPPNPDSGASGTDVQTVRALRNLGHEVTDVWDSSLQHRISHWNLHHAFEQPWSYRKAIQDRLRDGHYDVVLATQPQAYLAARWVRRHRPATLFLNRSHGWEANYTDTLAPHRRRLGQPQWTFPRGVGGRPLAWLLRKHCQWAADASHGVIVYATPCRDYIVAHHRVPKHRVEVLPPAAPTCFLEHPPPAWTERAPRSVLLVSTASFFKGVQDTLEIIRNTTASNLNFSFTWVTPKAMHAPLRARLDAAANSALELLEPVPQESLRSIYDKHRHFLFPSLYEGFGKAFLEAMSRGCCVVSTTVGGMRDVIVNGDTGLLAAPGDCAQMTQYLLQLEADPSVAASISTRAISAARRHTWEGSARQLAEFAHRLRAEFNMDSL